MRREALGSDPRDSRTDSADCHGVSRLGIQGLKTWWLSCWCDRERPSLSVGNELRVSLQEIPKDGLSHSLIPC